MDELFEVGRKYRNRDGRYEVLEINGDKMLIRYDDGRTQRVTVRIQERIWRNMLADREDEENRAQPSTSVSRPQITFAGLVDGDFKEGVAGTSWRARSGLGGLLAQQLSDVSGETFLSYAVYRRAQIYIVDPVRWDSENKFPAAKLFFRLNQAEARYGMVVEKNRGPLDSTWDWTRLLPALRQQQSVQEAVWSAMKTHNLVWQIDIWDKNEAGGCLARLLPAENPSTLLWSDEDGEEQIDWSTFADRLSAITSDYWCDLWLVATLDKETAVAQGVKIANHVVPAYQSLLPLYDAVTQ